MSRIGKKPIPIPAGVQVTLDNGTVSVKGPKGQLSWSFDPSIQVAQENGHLIVTRANDQPRVRALHGLTRSLVANMVTGVSTGFTKNLEIQGTGYRAQLQGRKLVLSLGFSHPVEIDPPEGITFLSDAPNRVSVSGIDKQLVGEVAAKIRALRPPEPYKGKGIRYAGEVVRRKAGKAGKTGKSSGGGKGGKK
jgi:large subunit ribosomal protein L6